MLPAERDSVLREAADRFLAAAGDGPWELVWCAGAGVVGAGAEMVDAETDALRSLLAAIGGRSSGRGSLFVASSAGGVYAGSSSPPFSEETRCVPMSPYGDAKLHQEQEAIDWARRTGNRAVIGRIANVYGPGQDLSKPQGLVSQVCLSLLLQRPLTLYVPLETARDYVYVDDCAAMVVRAIDDAAGTEGGATTVRLIATGTSVTVGQLLTLGRRVVKRHLPVVTAAPSRPVAHARDLRLDPRHPFPAEMRATSLPEGLRRTFDAMLLQLQHSGAGFAAPSPSGAASR